MPKAVLFDLDGVLVDTYEVWFHLLNDVARRLGYPPISRETYRETWGQGVEEDVRRFYPGRTIPEIQAEYARLYADHLPHLRVMEGADRALAALSAPKAVITNSPTPVAERALALAGLARHFATVVGSDQVPRSKPAPDMVLEACRRLDVRPAEAVVVGDSRFDEEAARAAGVPFVLFRSFAELRLA
ncbi:MAG TPA: HAD family hydrolase [Planctomycetota bacterium]|jgi:HAD superfamily hydrolase (TIGR01509 family)|nr:HAD family hydrolase [Planctomycetota bacterium]